MSEIYKKEIIAMYNDGMKMYDIGKKLKIRGSRVSDVINNSGIKKSRSDRFGRESMSHKKLPFDVNYFNKIDTNEKAYWLGFMYADGNISKIEEGNKKQRYGIEISLKKEDDYHLHNFKKELKYTGDIKYRKCKLNEKEFESCRISLSSYIMHQDLINHGCAPAKSLILQPPNFLDERFVIPFIFGYFDGDGCIGFYEERKSHIISIDGTHNFLSWIVQKLSQNGLEPDGMNIYTTKSKAYSLKITRRSNLYKLYDLFYNNNIKYMLGRKFDKFNDAIKFFDESKLRSDTLKVFADLD